MSLKNEPLTFKGFNYKLEKYRFYSKNNYFLIVQTNKKILHILLVKYNASNCTIDICSHEKQIYLFCDWSVTGLKDTTTENSVNYANLYV